MEIRKHIRDRRADRDRRTELWFTNDTRGWKKSLVGIGRDGANGSYWYHNGEQKKNE